MTTPFIPSRLPGARMLGAVALAFGLLPATWAASTDIAQVPLVTSSTAAVKPNLLFVLDDSGSMGNDYLPDEANFGSNQYGRNSYQCNGLGYNPDPKVDYPLPVDASGNALANASTLALDPAPTTQTTSQRTLSASVPAAVNIVASGSLTVKVTTSTPKSNWYSVGMDVTIFNNGDNSKYMTATVTGWDASSALLTVDVKSAVGTGTLSSPRVGIGLPSSPYYYKYTGTQPKMGWSYPGGVLDKTTTFYKECASVIGAEPGASVFTLVTVNSASPDAQKFANWLKYYRTRMLMMRSALSLAFKPMDDKYRIGFSTISETGVAEGSEFLDVRDFDGTQKTNFYSRFNSAAPNGYTPLRGALSKAGQYFAKRATDQSYDPVQYSCQKNFTILATDGYWNTPNESATYGPYKMDGTNVGQQDGTGTPRPMLDGQAVKVTTTEKWTDKTTTVTLKSTPTTSTVTTTKTTKTTTPYKGWKQNVYTLTGVTTQFSANLARCSSLSGSSCTVSVTTSAAHGFANGNTVQISGATPSVYNGSFAIANASGNTFTYTLTGQSSRPSNPSGTITVLKSPMGCPANQGKVSTQMQTRDQSSVSTLTEKRIDSTTTWSDVTTTTVVSTPKTHTIIEMDGKVTSDTTTSGSATSSSTSTTASRTEPTVTTNDTSTAAGADVYTAWVNTGAPTVSGGCVSAVPSPNPSTPTQLGGTTTSAPAPVVSSNTTNGSTVGSAVTSTGTPVTESGEKTVTSSTATVGGSSDSLADVAMYYYKTDLRDGGLSNCTGALGTSVCDNNVTPSGEDVASWQHMSTYTIGLGLSGVLKYDPNYKTQTVGDFYDIKQGTKNWPPAGPSATAANIDDLWHAAVNGRGTYFSASDPVSVAASLRQALNSIVEKVGAGSAAATSTLQPVQGDNAIYVAQFTSGAWTGDLLAYKIDLTTGEVPTTKFDADGNVISTADWSAAKQLDAKIAAGTARRILYRSGTALSDFDYAGMDAAHKGYFDNVCTKSPALSQCSGMSTPDKDVANSGLNLVNYLKGGTFPVYRSRKTALGDIGNSAPVFVGKPAFKYTEYNYAGFTSTNASRKRMVYVGANDGMLHAFNADTGEEEWAYVPSMVMPKLYRLADVDYGLSHQYLVDGTPTVADIHTSGGWKTVLIGGLNAGGKGYYALDITDPDSPKSLWEYTDSNLGYSFSVPVIAKRANGTWVVVFGSGYNNNTDGGNGHGHLYVLNAYTGVPEMTPLDTGEGSTGTPSGLARINAWVESDIDNTAKRFYGGDLLGNIWRFDIDGLLSSDHAPNVHPVAQLVVGGKAQPITVQPQVAEVTSGGVKVPVVFVGTGRYLGTSDLGDKAVQSIYGIKDPLTDAGLGDVRATGTLVQQTLTDAVDAKGQKIRKISGNSVDWQAKNGWYIDLPTSGERVNVDLQIVYNVLTVSSNIPSADACSAGGSSWQYRLDLTTGSALPGASVEGMAGMWLGNKQIVGATSYQLPNGTVVTENTYADGTLGKGGEGFSPGTAGPARRTSWRELVDGSN
ncbi:pilus assembly protein [Ideonella sp. BN130291]|uniref:pilus assembly protein n=1 Tax=Ideonella sp. BN130291 TaxID=3112940 RepID=UPI002E26F8DB|nr:PilC/PilY family type IV pilus protein [Ideonella sp. BN130291]